MSIGRRSFLASSALIPGADAVYTSPVSKQLENRLAKAIDSLELVDTHEHIPPEADRLAKPCDFFSLASHYVMGDLVSAGLSASDLAIINNRSATLADRWNAFEPYWKHARYSGYSQALRITVRDIYGVEDISLATLPKIHQSMAGILKPGFYDYVLRKRTRIRFAVVDDNWNAAPKRLSPDYFYAAHKFDRFITPSSPESVRALEALTGVSIASLADLKRAATKSVEQGVELGMVAVKTTLAYNRTLEFLETPAADAEHDFDQMMRADEPPVRGWRAAFHRPYRRMEDHMFHHVMQLAEAHHLPVQIHTGIFAGNGNRIVNSNPTALTNVFFLYPTVKFDLFHISYPYQGEQAVLAKLFPNVHANFCWAHIISPEVARRTLHEFLETIPVNKIFGFGGDYNFAELSYGHACMARRNVTRVLSEKVEDGFMNEEEALSVATLLLRDNGERFFAHRKRPTT